MNSVRLLTASSMLAVFAAGPVLAAPVDDFFERLNAWLEPIGGSVTASVPIGKNKAGPLTLKDVALIAPNNTTPLGASVEFGTVTTLDGDLMLVDSIIINKFDHTNDDVRVSADKITLSNVLLPPLDATDPYLFAQILGGVAVENLLVDDGVSTADIDLLSFVLNADPEIGTTSPTAFSAIVEVVGLTMPEQALRAFDLDKLAGWEDYLLDQQADIYLPIHWDTTNGNLTVADFEFTTDTLGTFAVGVQLGGVTMDVLSELAALGADQADGSPSDLSGLQATAVRLMSQLTYSAGKLVITDGGVVDFMLNAAATERKTTTEQAIAAAIDAVDDGLSSIKASDTLVEQATQSLALLLQEGGTLGIDAFPEKPVSILELAALGQTPAALIDRLGVEVVHVEGDE
ncbi:hypothetical protein [Devosia sp. 63-57]|uniref:hypothetical protein n=1 Tax=Devosia sp. 63-57 TaxID=1895751 RepID=UPI00257E73F6|nr:hypothetical protein [Devosia sp. 63-57]